MSTKINELSKPLQKTRTTSLVDIRLLSKSHIELYENDTETNISNENEKENVTCSSKSAQKESAINVLLNKLAKGPNQSPNSCDLKTNNDKKDSYGVSIKSLLDEYEKDY